MGTGNYILLLLLQIFIKLIQLCITQSWRVAYYGAGIVGIIIAALTAFTLKEPERQAIGEESSNVNADGNTESTPLWRVITQPRIVLLCLAASIRHCGNLIKLYSCFNFCFNAYIFTGGMCFAYNADLYYREYFPDIDLSWWLFAVTVGIGSVGVVVGGIVSDK